MIYHGIQLDLPTGKVSFSHSVALDAIQGQSSDHNVVWTDNLASLPWGQFRNRYGSSFVEASNIFSLLNMNYQVCNGGIAQYFFNGYNESRDPFHENDVARYDIDAQKQAFTALVAFAREVYPDRLKDNEALSLAAQAFEGLYIEKNAEFIETVYCEEDEYIFDEESGEKVKNPDYFEPYDETYYEDLIHGSETFDDIYYKANEYIEELLELRAQLCCKTLAREVERNSARDPELLCVLKEVFPASAFQKPGLSEQIHSASTKSSGNDSPKNTPVKGTNR